AAALAPEGEDLRRGGRVERNVRGREGALTGCGRRMQGGIGGGRVRSAGRRGTAARRQRSIRSNSTRTRPTPTHEQHRKKNWPAHEAAQRLTPPRTGARSDRGGGRRWPCAST